jgi:hypothetical protein
MEETDKRLRMSIPDYLKELAIRQSTDNLDDQIVNVIIQKLNMHGKVVCGFIYIEPYNREPISIKQFAQALIDKKVI